MVNVVFILLLGFSLSGAHILCRCDHWHHPLDDIDCDWEDPSCSAEKGYACAMWWRRSRSGRPTGYKKVRYGCVRKEKCTASSAIWQIQCCDDEDGCNDHFYVPRTLQKNAVRTTASQTRAPIFDVPPNSPTSIAPTNSPTSIAPTISPTSIAPTNSPSSKRTRDLTIILALVFAITAFVVVSACLRRNAKRAELERRLLNDSDRERVNTQVQATCNKKDNTGLTVGASSRKFDIVDLRFGGRFNRPRAIS